MHPKPKILICDDDLLLIELIEFRLAAKGYEVITARDGEEALEKVRSSLPDLVVLDAMMPGIDGFELLVRLKADTTLAHIPVVMLTARKGERDIVSALESGASDYLVKPFIPEELLARIEKYLPSENPGV
ncbi:response regulator transcription factor [Mariluticola halotolerans]|uniref:response regulator transcription factor n=1 Tax=Mariluticola halotolerans TaxID=2909283 RepID=UPI0026E2CA54|nr:response regulator [Mariluticola halotolerans]UJQ94690.1 response regulator [Mariluticola halotolerans]